MMMKHQLSAQSPPSSAIHRPREEGVARLGANGTDDVAVICFRRFTVMPHRRQLLGDGDPIELGSRAYDLLIALIKARGTLVTKEEIVNSVWPSTIVEECNLRAQIAALRKALGKDRDVIKTVTGRGYIFACETKARTPGSAVSILPVYRPVTLPRRLGPPTDIPTCAEAGPIVVVIDDDLDVREALESLLRSVNLQVELFASVQEFVDSERPARPACMVLDVRLPGRSGLDFHDELVRSGVHLPVVFISGHADVPMSVRAMKAGAVEFLTKPVRHQDLLDAIQFAIGRMPSVRL
jgi:DNA-binding response OmpR family regulator